MSASQQVLCLARSSSRSPRLLVACTSILLGCSRFKLDSRDSFHDLQVSRSANSSGLCSNSNSTSQTSRGNSSQLMIGGLWLGVSHKNLLPWFRLALDPLCVIWPAEPCRHSAGRVPDIQRYCFRKLDDGVTHRLSPGSSEGGPKATRHRAARARDHHTTGKQIFLPKKNGVPPGFPYEPHSVLFRASCTTKSVPALLQETTVAQQARHCSPSARHADKLCLTNVC